MNALLHPSVSCPELIGRSAHLAAVEHLLAQIAAGEAAARSLLISGEGGIGKSRLVAAITQRATAAGWRLLATACVEPYRAVPYAPLIDLTSAAFSERDAAPERFPPDAAPELRVLLPGLASAAGATEDRLPPTGPDAAHEQRRLFQALLGWLMHQAVAQPLLLVIEDIHWSDASSLAFLPLLAHSIGARPILLLVTFRAEEAPAPLVTALADLERQRLAVEVALARLSREQVGEMLQACLQLPQPASAELRDTLHAHTDGNPFFVEATLTALIAAGDLHYADGTWRRKALSELHIPRTVQEAVRQRSAALSSQAGEVLTIAAVLGRRFAFELLHRALGYDEATLLGVLKELISAQFIVEERADQFAFRHALGRAAIYSGLLVRERRLLHRRVAAALEQTAAHPGDLAHHFAEAGAWAQALPHAEAAAAQARRLYAPQQAIVHLTRALEAAQQLPDARRSPLFHLRGQAYETVGDFAAALADYEAALAAARSEGRAEDEWQALLDLGFLWSSRDYARAGDYLHRMLERARSLDDPTRLARSLNRLGNWQLNRDRPGTARRLHEEALAIVERLGDERGIAETLDLLGISCLLGGDFAQGTTYLGRSSARFTALDDQQGLIHSTLQMTVRAEFDIAAIAVAPLALRGAPLERAVALTREMHWRVGEALALMDLGAHLTGLGEYGRALDLLRSSRSVAADIEHRQCLTHADAQLGVLFLHLLCVPEAILHLQHALAGATQTGQLVMVGTTSSVLARAYAEQRSYDRATEVLAQAQALRAEAPEASIGDQQLRRATSELALARAKPEVALRLVDELLGDIVNPDNVVLPALWWLRGRALAELHRHEEAARIFAAGLQAAEVQGRQPLVWRLQAGLAAAAVGRRRRDEAQRFHEQARTTIDALAGQIVDAGLRERFRERANARLPTPEPLTPRQALKQVFGGLTDRELDVVRLIARGYTSRQIAETLTVSERTVTTHISNILGKLGFTSRAQIARWAAQQGIAPA